MIKTKQEENFLLKKMVQKWKRKEHKANVGFILLNEKNTVKQQIFPLLKVIFVSVTKIDKTTVNILKLMLFRIKSITLWHMKLNTCKQKTKFTSHK